MKNTAIYLLVDISKTPDGMIQPDIQKAIQLFFRHLDGISFKEFVNIYAMGLARSIPPRVKTLNNAEERLGILKWETDSSPGLDLASGLEMLIQDVQDRSHMRVKPIMFLNERSGTPIYKYIKKLERMSDIVESFIIVACSETAKLHQKNIPDALWIDMKDFLSCCQEILINWLSNVEETDKQDVIVNVGFNPISSLQEVIQKNNVAEIQLFPSEFKGPILIDKPLTIDGRGATIWVPKGPGVHIKSSGIQLKNLRIEVTDPPIPHSGMGDGCALKIEPDIQVSLNNILVRGTVQGLSREEGDWDYPHTLDLGMLPSGISTSGLLRIKIPTHVSIVSQVDGLIIDRNQLLPGFNEINISIEDMLPNTLIDGTITISTELFKRTIYVRGYVIAQKRKNTGNSKPRVFWQSKDWKVNLTNQQQLTPFEKFLHWLHKFNRREK